MDEKNEGSNDMFKAEYLLIRYKEDPEPHELKPVDPGFCPQCNRDEGVNRNHKDVIDSIDDEIGHECVMCDVEWEEIRQTVGYKGLRKRGTGRCRWCGQ